MIFKNFMITAIKGLLNATDDINGLIIHLHVYNAKPYNNIHNSLLLNSFTIINCEALEAEVHE